MKEGKYSLTVLFSVLILAVAIVVSTNAVMLGLIKSSQTIVDGVVRIKNADNRITVKGSHKKRIVSDRVVWEASFSENGSTLEEAYPRLQESLKKIKLFMEAKGVEEKDYVISSITNYKNYRMGRNGYRTNEVESYTISQRVIVSSDDVEKITKVSREATELLNEGVNLDSYPPQYFYTKLADLKIDMMAEATADAFKRAQQIASSSGGKVGALKSARAGIFQITPLYSNEVSGYGMFDTSSIEKEITSVMTCQFEILDAID